LTGEIYIWYPFQQDTQIKMLKYPNPSGSFRDLAGMLEKLYSATSQWTLPR